MTAFFSHEEYLHSLVSNHVNGKELKLHPIIPEPVINDNGINENKKTNDTICGYRNNLESIFGNQGDINDDHGHMHMTGYDKRNSAQMCFI